MAGQEERIAEALLDPDSIIESPSDPTVRLYYRHYPETIVTSKYLCAVVKWQDDDKFLITAYPTEKIKAGTMAENLKVWYDPEGDYLEVAFEPAAGYFRETAADQVMVKVDQGGRVIGFSILGYRKLKGQPLDVPLVAVG